MLQTVNSAVIMAQRKAAKSNAAAPTATHSDSVDFAMSPRAAAVREITIPENAHQERRR